MRIASIARPARVVRLSAIVAIALIAAAHPINHTAPTYAQSPLRDEAPAARAVLDNLLAHLDRIDARLDRIAAAADLAAEAIAPASPFPQRRSTAQPTTVTLTVAGDDALRDEMTHRPGAWQAMRLAPPTPRDVAIVVDARDLRIRIPIQGNELDDNTGHEPDEDSTAHNLTLLDDAPSPARTAAAWCFQLELFAALTRRDPPAVMVIQQCEDLDRRGERYRRYGDAPFHRDRWLDPIAPTRLAHDYLLRLRDVLRDVGTASYRDLAQAAGRARAARAAGGGVYLHPGPTGGGRLIRQRLAKHAFPGFEPMQASLLDPRGRDATPRPGPNDFVIAVGYREWPGSPLWGEHTAPLLRDAGRGVAWVVNSHNTHPRELAPPRRRASRQPDLLLDLQAPLGDTLVQVPHYDTRLGPASGVVAETIVAMLHAQARHGHPRP